MIICRVIKFLICFREIYIWLRIIRLVTLMILESRGFNIFLFVRSWLYGLKFLFRWRLERILKRNFVFIKVLILNLLIISKCFQVILALFQVIFPFSLGAKLFWLHDNCLNFLIEFLILLFYFCDLIIKLRKLFHFFMIILRNSSKFNFCLSWWVLIKSFHRRTSSNDRWK